GHWHDAPVQRVTLAPGESALRETDWEVPYDPPPPSGSYDVAMSVWDEHPARADAEKRLADARREDSFRVSGLRDGFGSLDKRNWEISTKELGRGSLAPENVRVGDSRLELKLPTDTFDGGEIKSKKLYQYGSYRARVKVADAPSSLTGFFLYKAPDLENELDIEIFNDSSRRIMFTTYSGGEETNNVRKKLPFDPTEDFHDYRFDFYPDRAEFYVDGELMHSFDEGLPEKAMNLYVNAWFPTWLSGTRPEKTSYTYVEWLRH
ncbi:MAG: glycoside hydrolase family 16 protein, partial [Rubrobacteraceae bacterium]